LKTQLLRLFALAAIAVLSIALAVPAGASDRGPAVAEAAKAKKCKKKKGKKCKKAKKKGTATGPEIALGDYYCTYGSFQVQAGNRYTVNRGDPGRYTYNPSLGIVNFQGGSYASFFGKYYPDDRVLELYSNVNDPPVEIGDYAWSCSQ